MERWAIDVATWFSGGLDGPCCTNQARDAMDMTWEVGNCVPFLVGNKL